MADETSFLVSGWSKLDNCKELDLSLSILNERMGLRVNSGLQEGAQANVFSRYRVQKFKYSSFVEE